MSVGRRGRNVGTDLVYCRHILGALGQLCELDVIERGTPTEYTGPEKMAYLGWSRRFKCLDSRFERHRRGRAQVDVHNGELVRKGVSMERA
jgi:hypothetical protein